MFSVFENSFGIPSFLGEELSPSLCSLWKRSPPRLDFKELGTTCDFDLIYDGLNISVVVSTGPHYKGRRVSEKWSLPSFFVVTTSSPKLISASPSSPSAFWNIVVFSNEFLSFVTCWVYPDNLKMLIWGNLLSLTLTSIWFFIYSKSLVLF